MRIVECIPEHYEVQEVGDLGRAYRWCPEKVMVECGMCGKRETFTRGTLSPPSSPANAVRRVRQASGKN